MSHSTPTASTIQNFTATDREKVMIAANMFLDEFSTEEFSTIANAVLKAIRDMNTRNSIAAMFNNNGGK